MIKVLYNLGIIIIEIMIIIIIIIIIMYARPFNNNWLVELATALKPPCSSLEVFWIVPEYDFLYYLQYI